MEPITFHNLCIEGIPSGRVLDLIIKHSINEHAQALIKVEAERDVADEYMKRSSQKTLVRITTTAEGQPGTIFVGVISQIGIDYAAEYSVLNLSLSSTSVLTDHQKKNKSFQNTAKTYEDIMNQTLDGTAIVDMRATDQPIGNLIVQYCETNWEFCKRMASKLNMPVITSIDGEVPVITVGVPENCKKYNVSDIEYNAGTRMERLPDVMPEDGFGIRIKTQQYMFLGDMVEISGVSQRVRSISAGMHNGTLIVSICIARETALKQPVIINQQISGKMFKGQVDKVEGDTVTVHFVDFGEESDSESTVMLPYSTAYSSADGSGFYCMPAQDDYVRVFFPSTDEGEAFAASSVSVNVGANISDKQWRGPQGKQILMTNEGIYITSNVNDNKIFINLTSESGISITSNKNITITAKKNLSLISNDTITINADNDILISSAESYIDIQKDKIEMGAENIVIN